MKSNRNKTINLTVEEGKDYLEKCIKINESTKVCDVLNRTINGDIFNVIPYLEKDSIDLIVADPPYNLDKNFHGKVFKKTNEEEYKGYTEKWISLVAPLLKKTGSIYVCCDWKCSAAIESVLRKYFIIQNRITWQRERGEEH